MLTKRKKTDTHLYEQVADKISDLIERGTLRPGERIPSVRRFSSQQKVSISTVLRAYFLLEDRGLVEAHPQSGFYVRRYRRDLPPEPRASSLPLSATPVGVGDLVTRVFEAAKDPDIIPLGAACPSPKLFPTARLNRMLATVAHREGPLGNTYDFPPGSPELQRQIARRALDWGCSLSPEEIVTTYGCMEALNLCLRAVARPGDTIAVESPTYFGILQAIESLGMKALEIPAHPRSGISLETLEIAVKRHKVRACVFMPNFHNPLGSCVPDENKKQLVEILARHEIPLIEDDIYGDLYFGTDRPSAAKAYDKKGLVLLCSSFSKTLAPGYRVGWTVPGRFQREVERLKFMTTAGGAKLLQLAIAEFLQNGGYDHYLRRIRKAYATQVQRMIHAMGEYFPEGTKVTRPSGGFVLWVELPKTINALDLHRIALEEHRISIAPGPIFSARQQYRNFIRLNCGFLWSDQIERALVTLGRLTMEMTGSQARKRAFR